MNYTKRHGYIARTFFMVILSVMLLVGCEGNNEITSTYNMKVTEATKEFYINDFSGIFTEEQKNEMMEKAINLDKDYAGIQVVITTVESLQGCVVEGSSNPSIEQVGYAMYNQYGIGQDDMGILVLFSSGDREVSIETGRRMQAYITDSKSGQLLDDYGMEYFKQNEFAEGLFSLQNGIVSEVKAVVPKDWNLSQGQNQELVQEEEVKEMEKVLPSKEEINKEAEEEQSIGILVALFVATGFMVYNLIGSVRKFFSIKRKLKESQSENEQLMARLQEQENDYERREKELQREHERNLYQVKQSYEEKEERLESDCYKKVNHCQEKIKALEAKERELEEQLQKLKEKLERLQRLYPEKDFEAEIQEMIEKEFQETAEKVDQELAQYLATPAKEDNDEYFKFAIAQYQSVRPEVKKYLQTDVYKLKSLYEESRMLRWKATAAKADRKYEQYLSMIVSKENVPVFKRAIKEYEEYSPEVQEYMVTDKAKLWDMYKKSVSLKEQFEREKQIRRDKSEAQKAEDEIRRMISRVGYHASASDKGQLEKALRLYRNLTRAQQAYVDQRMITKLVGLLEEAEEAAVEAERQIRQRKEEERRREEQKREERRREEERRRSYSSYNSTGSSFHSESFSGHGGRSGGGGASRHF